MIQKIIRTDGIEYERKAKAKKYTTSITIRIEEKQLSLLKEKANSKGIKYSDLVRKIIEDYIEGDN